MTQGLYYQSQCQSQCQIVFTFINIILLQYKRQIQNLLQLSHMDQIIKQQEPERLEMLSEGLLQQNQKKTQKQNQTISSIAIVQGGARDEFNTILVKQFKQMEGTPQQKIKRLMNRLQKFFLRDSNAKINIREGYFCQKREPYYNMKVNKQNVYVVQTQIILFGIDFMKHRQIVKLYRPDEIQTLDMSHIKLVYNDFFSAMDALRRNQRQGVQQNVIKMEENAKDPPKGWMEMRPYYISNYQRRVLARFATSEQLTLKQTGKLSSNIPLYAKKVYDLKKKYSKDIEQNCRLRDQQMRERKFQKIQRGSSRNLSQRTGAKLYERENRDSSEMSYRIGKGAHDRGEFRKQFQRERSRQKDFEDDNKSVASKKSSVSSLVGKFNNKMNIGDNEDSQSVVSDVSFILQRNPQVFQDMAVRLGLISLNEADQNVNQGSQQGSRSFNFNQGNLLNDSSFRSSNSSNSENYRLTDNMPDRRFNQSSSRQYSFSKKEKFNYNDYMKEQEIEEQRKQKQEKEMVVVIDDDQEVDIGANHILENKEK